MRFLLLVSFLLIYTPHAQSQIPSEYNDTTKYLITTTSGTEYIGYVLSDDGREILIQTDNIGKIYIPKTEVERIVAIDKSHDYRNGVFVGSGVFRTRYQFSSNALPVAEGETFAVLNLYGPEIHFALKENFTVGVMSTWIASPIALALKYTFPTKNEKLNFGLGTWLGSSGYSNFGRGFGGLHFGMVTYGDSRFNVTATAGYAYVQTGNRNKFFIPPGTYSGTEFEYGYYFDFPMDYKQDRLLSGPVFGLAGILSLSSKVSIYLDVMGIVSSQDDFYQRVEYSNTYAFASEFAQAYEPTYYSAQHNYMLIMPGIRFQKKPNRAFQVSVSGVVGFSDLRVNDVFGYYGNSLASGEPFRTLLSAPYPMFSWFFKF